MKLIYITPTNNPKYLDELYRSLKEQTNPNWNWFVLLNNTDKEYINEDPRVHIETLIDDSKNVGFYKALAFNRCVNKYDLLCEVDHDDLLSQDCTEELLNTYNSNIGFIYSNDIKFRTDGKDFVPYGTVFGWEPTSQKKSGNLSTIFQKSFNPTPISFSTIHAAPDHIRCWNSKVYKEVGGHADMYILDDLELMQKTFIYCMEYDYEIKYIPKPLYLYRVDGNNTWLQRNKEIQELNEEMRKKSLQSLCEVYAKNKRLSLLDLGGGLNPRKGYLAVDVEQPADVIIDLNDKHWNIKDNSAGVVNASHVFEHLKDINNTMKNLHRILHEDGVAFIDVPSTDGRGAFQDPTHVSYWNYNSFFYWIPGEQADFIRNKDTLFRCLLLEDYYPNDWFKRQNILVTRAWLSPIKNNNRNFGYHNTNILYK